MNRYVKKPIAIEAVKWEGFNNDEIKDFAGDNVKIEVIREGDADRGIPPCIDCSIKTLEGVMTANVGDYIIKGVNGEFYPCKPDIFEKTYLHKMRWVIYPTGIIHLTNYIDIECFTMPLSSMSWLKAI